MSTGHILPGYRDSVSKFHRAHVEPDVGAQSLKDKIDLTNAGHDFEFERIRQNARDVWMQPDREQTTYGNFHNDKSVDVDEWQYNRPTSAERKNKPHPPHVFLTTRLHSIPGYHNPDATLGKPTYKIDPSVSREVQSSRASLRSKYTPLQSAQARRQYDKKIDFKEMGVTGRDAQGLDAMMQMVDKEDQDHIMQLGEAKANSGPGKNWQNPLAPQPKASTHRYLKTAGPRELDALDQYRKPGQYGSMGTYGGYTAPIDKSSQKQNGDYHRGHCQTYIHDQSTNPVMDHTGWRVQPPWGRTNINDPNAKPLETYSSAKHTDAQNMRRSAGVTLKHPRANRGDFLMHPDWPPTIPHHRLPCLC
ncbi:unnamed protein product [Owenia fusiformis]|uniref:Uncharacterized protein n=1 Tax=Owenia fusiformis TaxID=6347 RepID=A0A8J1XLW2_OWEFU|nr:unnamed protein product [Owenia fusiformis]